MTRQLNPASKSGTLGGDPAATSSWLQSQTSAHFLSQKHPAYLQADTSSFPPDRTALFPQCCAASGGNLDLSCPGSKLPVHFLNLRSELSNPDTRRCYTCVRRSSWASKQHVVPLFIPKITPRPQLQTADPETSSKGAIIINQHINT